MVLSQMLVATLAIAGAVAAPPPSFSVRSAEPVQVVLDRLSAEASALGFSVTATHDLAETLASKGFPRPPYVVAEICNAKVASGVLEADPKIGSVLPCRVAVYQVDDGTELTTVRPTALLGMFSDDPSLAGHAQWVENAMLAMMERAVSPAPEFEALWLEAGGSYRDALFSTKAGDSAIAEPALAKLSEMWAKLAPGAAPYSQDPEWAAESARVTAWIQEAQALVTGGRLEEAHEVLESVRGTWATLRERVGRPTFADALTRYHDLMEVVYLGYKDARTPPVAPLLDAWAAVKTFPRPPLPLEQDMARSEAMQRIEANLEDMAANPRPEAAAQLQPLFAAFFKRFG